MSLSDASPKNDNENGSNTGSSRKMATKLFISYCWKRRKDEIRLLAKCLSQNYCYEIWIDTEEMSGSTYNAMAKGIDDADLILMFFGEGYKSSENCKKEAEYASMHKKPILPIRVEKDTQLHGWIGFVLGQRLWIDFSDACCDIESTAANVDRQITLILSSPGNAALLSSKPSTPSSEKASFKAIDVPFFSRYFERAEEQDNILTELKKTCLKPKEGMLVLTGGGGVGKTSLVAHLFSDGRAVGFLQKQCNINIAIWMNCFQWNDQAVFDDEAEHAFIAKLLQLAQRASGGRQSAKFFGIDDVIDFFENRLETRLIFVLDDVYNTKLLECIYRQCPQAPCLAVTRDLPGVAKPRYVRKVLPLNEPSDDDISRILAETYELDSILSKKQIDELASRCCRLPLIASLFAARFDECFDPDSEFEQLVTGSTSELGVDDGPHETVLQLFEFSISRLDAKLRKSYQAFLFFNPAEPVFVEDLAVLWGFSGTDAKIKANALCCLLEKKNLVRRVVKIISSTSNSAAHIERVQYLVHQLLFEAAVENAAKTMEPGVDALPEVRRQISIGDMSVSPKKSIDKAYIVVQAIEQQRRSIIKRMVENCKAQDLLSIYTLSSKDLTKGQTLLHHLYQAKWSDNVDSDGRTRLYSGVNHSYRLIHQLIAKMKRDGVNYCDLFRVKSPVNGKSLLFEIYDGGARHFNERKGIKRLLSPWEHEYEEEKWLHNNIDKNPCLREIVAGDGIGRVGTSNETLKIAARLGKLDFVKECCESPSNNSEKCKKENGDEGRTPLMYAAKNGHLKVVEYLVKADPMSVGVTDHWRRSALIHGATYGHFEVIKLLASQMSVEQINLQDGDGETALIHSAGNGHLTCVELLLKVGGSDGLTLTDNDGKNALMMATENGHEDVVKFLLEKDDNLAKGVSRRGSTAMMMAAANGDIRLTTMLLEIAPEAIKLQDMNGMTALALAAEGGHIDIVRYFFESSGPSSCMVTDKQGRSCVMLASSNGHLDVVTFIVEKVPDSVKIVDSKGRTALLWAMDSGLVDLVVYLTERYPEALEMKSKNGMTPLMCAAENGDSDVVEYLLRTCNEACITLRCDRNEFTAFNFACSGGDLKTVQLIYDRLTNLNEYVMKPDRFGRTVLLIAVLQNRVKVTEFLLKRHPSLAEIGDKDKGLLPIHVAVEKGFLDIFKAFYDANPANVKMKTQNGENCIELAEKNNSNGILNFLKEKYNR